MSSNKVSIEEARKRLGDYINAALLTGTTTIITRNGRPAARIAPLEDTVINAETAVTILVNEGHDRDKVLAAIDSLIDAGLDLDQPDEGTVLSASELDLLRDQLAATVYEIHTEVLNGSGSWECIDIEKGTRKDFDQARVNSDDIGGEPGQQIRVCLVDPELDGDARVIATRELETY